MYGAGFFLGFADTATNTASLPYDMFSQSLTTTVVLFVWYARFVYTITAASVFGLLACFALVFTWFFLDPFETLFAVFSLNLRNLFAPIRPGRSRTNGYDFLVYFTGLHTATMNEQEHVSVRDE